MFGDLKLYFTDRPRYEQHKRYLKCQRYARKRLKKLAKEFCPWSGYYMHEMIKTMLEFYYTVYDAKDWCWSVDDRLEGIATSLKQALDYSDKLDAIDDMECSDLLVIAEEFDDFSDFCTKIASDMGTTFEKLSEDIRGYLAFEFLEKKYTSLMYNTIGENIWRWSD